MKLAVELASNDPSPNDKAECLSAIATAHYSGMLELVITTYQTHLSSPSPEIRKAVAGRMGALPADDRIGPMVRTLLADRSQEVRRTSSDP